MKDKLIRFGSVTCITILVLATFVVVEMTVTHNAVADTVPPPIINIDITWDIRGQPYWIEYNVTVTSNATLTIEPGVEVRFNGSYSLIINGDLIAIGNASDQIIFTSNFSSPNPGDWGSIRFNKWEYLGLDQYISTIKYATIEYATIGVYCANRTIAMENSMIRNSTIGVFVGNESIPFLSNNTIMNNVENGIDWMNTNVPPVVWLRPINWIWNNTITNNGNIGINLITYTFPLIESNNIYFNNYGIYMYNSIAGELNNNIIGNNVSNNEYGIYLYNSSNTNIINNNVLLNTYYGICLSSSSNNNITTNKVLNNAVGISLYHSSENKIRGNTVMNNNHGIYLNWQCNSNTITNNYVSNSGDDGIYLIASSYNNIKNNNVSNNIYGIYLYSSLNNNITGNNVLNEILGVYLIASSNNNITNNYISNSSYAIYLVTSSNKNKITNNNVSNNGGIIYIRESPNNDVFHNFGSGIDLFKSSSSVLINNTIIDFGIMIRGDVLNHWNTHTIDTTNTVNGRPLYYRKNQTGGTIPLGAGQVILANCTNVVVQNQNVSDVMIGIELGFSSGNTIIGNNFSSNSNHGIYLYKSNENNITDNNASSNRWGGILLSESSENNITGNTLSNNDRGIGSYYSSNSNLITGNNISSNYYYGIYLYDNAVGNIIYNNTIGWNGRAGIKCEKDCDPIITHNDIENNEYGVLSQSGSDPTIHNNTISGNTEYGVKNEDSGVYIHAEYNYWGASNGPEKIDSGPPPPLTWDGDGDKVYKWVYFYPYLSSPP